MRSSIGLLLLAACGNHLPSEGDCSVNGDGTTPTAEAVMLGPRASFDDLTYSASLGRVMAAPEGVGSVYLVDPESLEVTAIDNLPSGVASLDEGRGFVFIADRGGDAILVVDPSDGRTLSTFALDANPDYVRFCASTGELWVTEPGRDRIAVLAIAEDGALSQAAFIDTPGGPEGLGFDNVKRRAFVHASGDIAAIDIDQRKVIATWPTGCGGSHGIPKVDEQRGLVFAGCRANGGGAVLDTDDGSLIAGYEAGGGAAILGYSPSLGHFYLRGDPGEDVDVLGVCETGVSLLGTAKVSSLGHGMTSDDRGNAWVCDATTGGLFRVTDPYPATD